MYILYIDIHICMCIYNIYIHTYIYIYVCMYKRQYGFKNIYTEAAASQIHELGQKM